MERVKSGIPGLDEMVKGGFLPNSNILVSGPCGSGKSTIALQYVYKGATEYNEPGIFITLERKPEDIIRDALNFGWDIKKNEKLIALAGGPFSSLASYMDETKANVEDMIDEIAEIVRGKKAKRVAIDSLNLFTMLFKDAVQKRRALVKLCGKLSELGCTTLLTCETKEALPTNAELSISGIEEYVADGVILLYYSNQLHTFIQGIAVRKMRGSNHDKNVRPFFIKEGFGAIVEPTQEVSFGAKI